MPKPATSRDQHPPARRLMGMLGVVLLVGAELGCSAELRTGSPPPSGPIPQLGIAPRTVTFSYTPGGTAPAPQTVGLTSSPGTLDGLIVGTILYAPITSGWLAADLVGGSTVTPASVVLTVTPPSDLGPGTYVAQVPVGSTVAGVVPQNVVATLTVDSVPAIALSPSTVTIGVAQGGGNPATQFVQVDNGGSGTLSGLSVGLISYGAGASGWLGASLSQATAPASLSVQVTSVGLGVGTYTARVPVLSALPGVAPETLTVSLGVSTVSAPPRVVVSPTNVLVSGTVGGANPAPQSVAVSNGGGGTLSGLGVGGTIYTTTPGGWLTVSLNTTTAPAIVGVQVATGALPAGTHIARVPVTSSLPGVTPDTFTVSFTVGATQTPPTIGLAPSAQTFTANAGGLSPGAATVGISNAGGGTLAQLSLGAIVYGPGATGWVSASLSNTTAPATILLTPTLGTLAIGTYTATIPVRSGLIGVAAVNLTVTFQVVGPPVPASIGYAPTSVSFNAQGGGASPAAKTIAVTNSGGSTLSGLAVGPVSYSPGQPTGWLGTSLAQTTAPTTITLTPTTGTLAPGTYNATVPITSAVANNSPRNITVTFTVTAPPTLVLTPTTVTFTGTTGQPSPNPAAVSITNGGAGTLVGLAAGAVSYGAGQPTGWLTPSLSGSSSPATLVLSATTGGLTAGTYSATVPVTTTTAGVASKTVTVSFQVAAPAGGLVILQGNNQSGLVGTTLPVTLQAQVLDASSNPRPGASVIWQVNNGGTLLNQVSVANAQGIVSADWKVGPLAGTHTTTVSSAGVPTQTFQADVLLPNNPNAHPNEPAGYIAFAEHNFSSLPSSPASLGGLLGKWYNDPFYAPSNLVVVTPDLTAPESPPNVLQTRFPTGLIAGRAPVYTYGWDAAGSVNGQKSKFYFSLRIKIPGTDFEAAPAVTKLGFIGYASAPHVGINQGFFGIKNGATAALLTKFTTAFFEQFPLSRTLGPNVDTRQLFSVGVWHQWEAVFEINTVGVPDGTFKMWIDGVKITDLNDVLYRPTGSTNKFFQWTWNPTWGGLNATKSRPDFVLIDHVYMSGLP